MILVSFFTLFQYTNPYGSIPEETKNDVTVPSPLNLEAINSGSNPAYLPMLYISHNTQKKHYFTLTNNTCFINDAQ